MSAPVTARMVTSTRPAGASLACTTICVLLMLRSVASALPRCTVLTFGAWARRSEPCKVTRVPTCPEAGLMAVMLPL